MPLYDRKKAELAQLAESKQHYMAIKKKEVTTKLVP